jgi:antitoxin ParD1/3/4
MPSSYALGERLEQFIKNQVESGRYGSASEVVREALRLLEDREQQRQVKLDVLKEQIKKGIESGEGKDADEIFERLEAKYRARLDETTQ